MTIILHPLETYFRENADYSHSDIVAEMQLLIDRQAMVYKVLQLKQSPQDLLDLLESQGFCPATYQDFVVDNVDFLLSQNL